MNRDQLSKLTMLFARLDEARRQLHVARDMPPFVRARITMEGRDELIDLPKTAVVQWATNRVTSAESAVRNAGGTVS